jgi:surface polysaccharide O-acyltransferase-like enzyme
MRLSNLAGAPPFWWQFSYSVTYSIACTLICLAVLALFLRFAQGEKNLFDPLREDAYGMYVVHYIPVLWLQYALLTAPLPAIAKALIVFIGTVGLSWGVTAALRKIPGVKRVL